VVVIIDNKASIIIPAWNCLPWIEQCLNSARNQSHGETEIVIVYGFSNDGSDAWLEKNASDCVLVRFQSRLTPNQAILAGLAESTGEFIFFLDSDDWLAVDAIESLLTGFTNPSCDVVFGRRLLVYGDNIYPSVSRLIAFDRRLPDSAHAMLHTCLFRSVFLHYLADRHHEFLKQAGFVYDFILAALSLVENPKGIIRLDKDVYYYRQRQESRKRRFRPQVTEQIKTVLQYCHEIQKNRSAADQQSARPAYQDRSQNRTGGDL